MGRNTEYAGACMQFGLTVTESCLVWLDGGIEGCLISDVNSPSSVLLTWDSQCDATVLGWLDFSCIALEHVLVDVGKGKCDCLRVEWLDELDGHE